MMTASCAVVCDKNNVKIFPNDLVSMNYGKNRNSLENLSPTWKRIEGSIFAEQIKLATQSQ